ncbi:MAG: ATP-binding protein [Gemmatimonadota bacterium]|nr:ATP-binding protein [Gemmatimonadota bacterium]
MSVAPAAFVRVCVTGPESTGKTTLARRLAEWLGTEWVPEASRVYAERVRRELLASDVVPIAREHIALVEAGEPMARAGGSRSIILDTDLVSTAIYSRYYYGAVPRWVARQERERRADLYLLCAVDVPWVPDGIRDRPTDREQMFARFDRALKARRSRLVIISGDWDTRWAIARSAVASLLEAGG